MANIKTYEAPGLALHPTEIGIDALQAAARRGGAFFNQIAEARQREGQEVASTVKDVGDLALQYETHREISKGSADAAQLQDGLTQQWNQIATNADPNDPTVAQKFREQVLEPQLEKFQSGFNTEQSQNWAQHFASTLREHMFTKTAADMSLLAGEAFKKNVTDSSKASQNTAYNDPTSVEHLLDNVDHSIDGLIGSSPNLRGADAQRARIEISDTTKAAIVRAGAMGAISKSPDPEKTAADWGKKYPQYLTPDDQKALATNARHEIRARNYDYELTRRRAKEDLQDRSNNATNQYLIDVRSADPRLAQDQTAQKILHDNNLTKTDKNNLLNYIDRQAKPETEARLSQQTFVGLLRDLRQPDADVDQVMQRAWDARLTDPGKANSLSERDFNQFRQEVQARKTPEGAALQQDRAQFFKQYAGTIDKDYINPVLGSTKIYLAEQEARRMENMLHQKGLDPHLAYDPASEYFLGKPERLQKFQGSLQLDLQDRATFNQRFGNLPPSQQAAEQRVSTKAEYDKLPPGTVYVSAKDGQRYRKQ